MTQFEKDEAIRVLREKMLSLQAAMSEGDTHAIKCVKLGVSFAETYPDEFLRYQAARADYNECEEQLAAITEAEIEDEHPAEL